MCKFFQIILLFSSNVPSLFPFDCLIRHLDIVYCFHKLLDSGNIFLPLLVMLTTYQSNFYQIKVILKNKFIIFSSNILFFQIFQFLDVKHIQTLLNKYFLLIKELCKKFFMPHHNLITSRKTCYLYIYIYIYIYIKHFNKMH